MRQNNVFWYFLYREASGLLWIKKPRRRKGHHDDLYVARYFHHWPYTDDSNVAYITLSATAATRGGATGHTYHGGTGCKDLGTFSKGEH